MLEGSQIYLPLFAGVRGEAEIEVGVGEHFSSPQVLISFLPILSVVPLFGAIQALHHLLKSNNCCS